MAPLLRRLISPTRTRARIYDYDGTLILDSRGLYIARPRAELRPAAARRGEGLRRALVGCAYGSGTAAASCRSTRRSARRTAANTREVASALNGQAASVVRVGEDGGLIVSVAVPVQRYRAILGSLLLSTESGDIDEIVQGERMAILRVFRSPRPSPCSCPSCSPARSPARCAGSPPPPSGCAAASGIAARRSPISATARTRSGISRACSSDMTNALYKRMEAIESFAADVSHELKNPLTSLRSAVETLPIAKTDEQRARLLGVIKHDVKRLDRLITDISDASRLDAELAREATEPVDIAKLLETVVSIARETRVTNKRKIQLALDRGRWGKDAFYVLGHDSRLGQVFNNLIDNALSFSPPEGSVRIRAWREADTIVGDGRRRRTRHPRREHREHLRALLHRPPGWRRVRPELRARPCHHAADRRGASRHDQGGEPQTRRRERRGRPLHRHSTRRRARLERCRKRCMRRPCSSARRVC